MKKEIMFGLLSLLILTTVCGCTSKGNTGTSPSSSTATQSVSTTEEDTSESDFDDIMDTTTDYYNDISEGSDERDNEGSIDQGIPDDGNMEGTNALDDSSESLRE